MRAVVTGHTRGVGAGIAAALSTNGWEIVGLSRSTGCDIGTGEGVAMVVEACRNADLLVNNAHFSFRQVDILYSVASIWRDDPSKSVLCIGSRAPDWSRTEPRRYDIEKDALDRSVLQLQLAAKWRLMLLRLGYVDTPRVAHVTAPKLPVKTVVDAAMWMLNQPAGILAGRVDLAPSGE